MVKSLCSATPPDQHDDTHQLLEDLLYTPTPSEDSTTRPKILRSNEEQRRIAFSPFLVRTWLDHALHRIEIALVLALIVIFGYWLFDGYGRDWLYAQGLWRPQSNAIAQNQSDTTSLLQATAISTGDNQIAALPFTTPDMEFAPAAPDFLAPRAMVAPAAPEDPRPQTLIVPTIEVHTPVHEVFVQDGVWQVADYAAGYHHGSALPGSAGNTVMAGHAGLRGGIFRNLNALQIGDDVIVETSGWRYRYQVREKKSVWPTHIEVMAATPDPTLTLITCTAWDTQRLIVVADLIDSRPLI